jgi:hypothetical protein
MRIVTGTVYHLLASNHPQSHEDRKDMREDYHWEEEI